MIKKYLTQFLHFFSEDRVKIFDSIERTLDSFLYDDHIHLIEETTNYYSSSALEYFKARIELIYRETIDEILASKGVLLKNPYSDDLLEIAEIFNSVIYLLHTNLNEIDDILHNKSEDKLTFFSEVISSISNISIEDSLQLIEYVDDNVYRYLSKEETFTELEDNIKNVSLLRLKKYITKENLKDNKNSEILNTIKCMDKVGYDYKSILHFHSRDINDMAIKIDNCLDIRELLSLFNLLKNELIILFLGSSLPVEKLIDHLSETIDALSLSSSNKLKLLTIINKELDNLC